MIPMVIYIAAIVIYVVGIFIYLDDKTTYNVKYHEDNSFFGGYTSSSNRDVTSNDVRWSLIWPILLMIFFVKTSIWLLNDLLYIPLLIVGFHYKETRLYYFIDRKFG